MIQRSEYHGEQDEEEVGQDLARVGGGEGKRGERVDRRRLSAQAGTALNRSSTHLVEAMCFGPSDDLLLIADGKGVEVWWLPALAKAKPPMLPPEG